MRLLNNSLLTLPLACLLASPALAQVSSPPTASQITPSYRNGPRYRTPDVVRELDINADSIGPLDSRTNRLRTYSLEELERLNRLNERSRNTRRLEVVTVPDEDWRLGLSPERRLRMADLTSRHIYEQPNIPATARLRKEDNLTSWREYIGQTRVRVYDRFNDTLDVPPPGLSGPTPAPGSTYR